MVAGAVLCVNPAGLIRPMLGRWLHELDDVALGCAQDPQTLHSIEHRGVVVSRGARRKVERVGQR